MVGVSLCSKARRLSAASSRSTSAIRRSAARRSCTLKQVSSTSEEVMPWCTKRASGPTISARWVRNAMTSCLTSRSISSMRVDVEVGVAALVPDLLGRRFRDDAELGHGVGGMRLDLEPDAKARLRLPDRRPCRAGCSAGSCRFSARQRRRLADGRDVGPIGSGVPPLNTAEPATSTLAPACATCGAVSGVMPPSTSMSIGRPPASAREPGDLLDRARDEGLAAEARD